jgi:hypothetical protein
MARMDDGGPLRLGCAAGDGGACRDPLTACANQVVESRVQQHRVDPLLQAFKRLWQPPSGCTIAVGLDDRRWEAGYLYDEAISNPVYITRVYLTPATISLGVSFRVVVETKYRP